MRARCDDLIELTTMRAPRTRDIERPRRGYLYRLSYESEKRAGYIGFSRAFRIKRAAQVSRAPSVVRLTTARAVKPRRMSRATERYGGPRISGRGREEASLREKETKG